MWWIKPNHIPALNEVKLRLEYFDRKGESKYAFPLRRFAKTETKQLFHLRIKKVSLSYKFKDLNMDAKITLSFDRDVIEKAKSFADSQNISLSRLTEFLYRQITSGTCQSLEELPVADWVMQVAEGKAECTTKYRSRRSMKKDFFDSLK